MVPFNLYISEMLELLFLPEMLDSVWKEMRAFFDSGGSMEPEELLWELAYEAIRWSLR